MNTASPHKGGPSWSRSLGSRFSPLPELSHQWRVSLSLLGLTPEIRMLSCPQPLPMPARVIQRSHICLDEAMPRVGCPISFLQNIPGDNLLRLLIGLIGDGEDVVDPVRVFFHGVLAQNVAINLVSHLSLAPTCCYSRLLESVP